MSDRAQIAARIVVCNSVLPCGAASASPITNVVGIAGRAARVLHRCALAGGGVGDRNGRTAKLTSGTLLRQPIQRIVSVGGRLAIEIGFGAEVPAESYV